MHGRASLSSVTGMQRWLSLSENIWLHVEAVSTVLPATSTCFLCSKVSIMEFVNPTYLNIKNNAVTWNVTPGNISPRYNQSMASQGVNR